MAIALCAKYLGILANKNLIVLFFIFSCIIFLFAISLLPKEEN